MCDLGTYNVPFDPDRKFKGCICDIGINNLLIYSGVILFKALYVRIAVLYLILLATEVQPSSWNIRADGVSKSALRIMRAARFCSFINLSIFAAVVDPHVTEP